VLLGMSPRHEAPVAQVLPFMQQPPPRLAGHENQPVEQVYGVVDDGAGVVETGVEVGTMITAVEDGGGGDGEDEGRT